MTKIITAKRKKSRRLGVSLWGEGKDPIHTRNFPPGQHGPLGYKPLSDFGKQLAEKQKLRCHYNMTEKQFKGVFSKAVKTRGDTIENFIRFLEARLDVMIYRSGLAPTIFAARQVVGHRHVMLNGKKVNIPSMRVSVGDKLEIKERSKKMPMIMESAEKNSDNAPDYLKVDPKGLTVELSRAPIFSDVPFPMELDPKLIIEFYSR